MPSADAVIATVLRTHGFVKMVLPVMPFYTAEDFARNHKKGTFVLAFGGHVATVIDGVIYDAWNSSNETPIYYFYRR